MEGILTALATHGPMGLVAAMLALWLMKKDKELAKERESRIADSRDYLDLALKLQNQVIEAVNKLSAVFEEVRKLIPPPRRPP